MMAEICVTLNRQTAALQALLASIDVVQAIRAAELSLPTVPLIVSSNTSTTMAATCFRLSGRSSNIHRVTLRHRYRQAPHRPSASSLISRCIRFLSQLRSVSRSNRVAAGAIDTTIDATAMTTTSAYPSMTMTQALLMIRMVLMMLVMVLMVMVMVVIVVAIIMLSTTGRSRTVELILLQHHWTTGATACFVLGVRC